PLSTSNLCKYLIFKFFQRFVAGSGAHYREFKWAVNDFLQKDDNGSLPSSFYIEAAPSHSSASPGVSATTMQPSRATHIKKALPTSSLDDDAWRALNLVDETPPCETPIIESPPKTTPSKSAQS
ncbi:hypothetical protein ACNFH5_29715, partial [Pseudomonas sp. NY15435]|uniref:hypothetical protein n=1 Tax=Pseudomonas sp. NY15435 TaxID=3400358 RepID=UPI003A88ECA2